jgi:hypothetical protein
MRRRAVLGALGASVGVFAGCTRQSRASSGASDAVTPAPVPTGERDEFGTAHAPDARVPSSPGCPLLPREADVYVCSPRPSPGELRLFPDRQRFVRTPVGPSDPLPITLQNSSQIPFETRRGWWVLSRNDANGWTRLDAGRSDERFDVGPGDAFVWRVGSDARSETGGRSHDVPATVSEGVYAFGVHGFHRDARLVALHAPFEVVVRP